MVNKELPSGGQIVLVLVIQNRANRGRGGERRRERKITAATPPTRRAAVRTNAMYSRLARGWSCLPRLLLASPVETSNPRIAENQGRLRHFLARQQARVAKARPQQKFLLHTCRHKTRGRNAECAGIPDRAPDRARRFR